MDPAIIIGTVRSLWTWLWGRYHVPQNVFLVLFKVRLFFTHSFTVVCKCWCTDFSALCYRYGVVTVFLREPISVYWVTHTAWQSSESSAQSPIHTSLRRSSAVPLHRRWILRRSAAFGETLQTTGPTAWQWQHHSSLRRRRSVHLSSEYCVIFCQTVNVLCQEMSFCFIN